MNSAWRAEEDADMNQWEKHTCDKYVIWKLLKDKYVKMFVFLSGQVKLGRKERPSLIRAETERVNAASARHPAWLLSDLQLISATCSTHRLPSLLSSCRYTIHDCCCCRCRRRAYTFTLRPSSSFPTALSSYHLYIFLHWLSLVPPFLSSGLGWR